MKDLTLAQKYFGFDEEEGDKPTNIKTNQRKKLFLVIIGEYRWSSTN